MSLRRKKAARIALVSVVVLAFLAAFFGVASANNSVIVDINGTPTDVTTIYLGKIGGTAQYLVFYKDNGQIASTTVTGGPNNMFQDRSGTWHFLPSASQIAQAAQNAGLSNVSVSQSSLSAVQTAMANSYTAQSTNPNFTQYYGQVETIGPNGQIGFGTLYDAQGGQIGQIYAVNSQGQSYYLNQSGQYAWQGQSLTTPTGTYGGGVAIAQTPSTTTSSSSGVIPPPAPSVSQPSPSPYQTTSSTTSTSFGPCEPTGGTPTFEALQNGQTGYLGSQTYTTTTTTTTYQHTPVVSPGYYQTVSTTVTGWHQVTYTTTAYQTIYVTKTAYRTIQIPVTHYVQQTVPVTSYRYIRMMLPWTGTFVTMKVPVTRYVTRTVPVVSYVTQTVPFTYQVAEQVPYTTTTTQLVYGPYQTTVQQWVPGQVSWTTTAVGSSSHSTTSTASCVLTTFNSSGTPGGGSGQGGSPNGSNGWFIIPIPVD